MSTSPEYAARITHRLWRTAIEGPASGMDVAEWLAAAAAVTCDRGLAVEVLSADLAAGSLSPVESDGAKAVLALYHLVLAEAQDDDRHRTTAERYFRDLAGSRPWAVPGRVPGGGDETVGMALAVQVDVLGARVRGEPEPLADTELDDAIELLLTVVNGFPPFRPDHLHAVSLLSELTRQRYTRTRDPADLYAALVAAEDLGKAHEPGTADFVMGLLLYAAAIAEWARSTNSPDNLDVLVGMLEGELTDARAHGLEADVLRAMAMVRGVRLELEGEDAESVGQAIDEALRAEDQDSSAEGLVNYAGLVVRQALAAPGDEAFQAAVSAARRAVEAGRQYTTVAHAVALGTLSYALRARFEFRGELQDIASAVTSARQAASLLAPTDPQFPGIQVNLLAALARRATHDPTLEHHHEAVAAGREALDLVAADDPLRYKLVSSQGSLLITLHLVDNQDEHIAEAVEILRAAVESFRGASTPLSVLCANLGNAYRVWAFTEVGRDQLEPARELLAEAVRFGERARAVVRPENPQWAVATNNLGLTCAFAGSVFEDEQQVRRAVELLGLVAHSSASDSLTRLESTRWLLMAALEAEMPEAVTDAYAVAVEQAGLVAFEGLSRPSQERLLAEWSPLVQDAATWAAADWRWNDAAAILEQGRVVLWAQATRLRTAADRLGDPELATQIGDVRSVLEARPDLIDADAVSVDERMAAASRWARLREDPRVAQAVRPPAPERLRGSLGEETVVHLVAGEHGAFAIVLRQTEEFPVRLDVAAADVKRAADELMSVLDGIDADRKGFGLLLADHLRGLLAWLWDNVVGKVVKVMSEPSPWFAEVETTRRARLLDRVVWCPTGFFALLPLHAAGHYTRSGPVPGKNALERMVSSYTSTVGILTGRSRGGTVEPKRLLVDYGLPGEGRDELRKALGPETVMEDGAATRQAVTAALADHDQVHFACHGRQILDRPSEAALELADGRLRLSDIPETARTGAFAFLAACSTSTGGRRVPDESLTIVTAFHYAGWERVIGTLWPASDVFARTFTSRFYALHATRDPVETASTLNELVLDACRRAPLRPDRWAAYVHVGLTRQQDPS